MKTDTPVYYIFASPGQTRDESPSTVFYRLQGESIATSLCNLFTREYADGSGRPVFHHKAAASISNEEKVLLDESLGWVDVYYDPDREIYDPPPSKHMHFRAQCAVRARAWEELLREQAETCQKNGTQETNGAEKWNPPNTDELPEMPAEDLRNSGLILLMLLAQAYYKMLESTISMASWVAALDLELNQYYFWTLKSITNLLKHHGDLKDFPEPFEPLFPDLYPSTIGDVDWEDGVAPNAEQFLCTVQQYVHSKGAYDPPERSPAWIFIELFRPSINAAIESAIAYNKRMKKHLQQVLDSSPKAAGESTKSGVTPASDDESIQPHIGERPEPEAREKSASASVNTPKRRFKIALSFPGERRDFVEQVASHLADWVGQDRVLYDKYYEAEFARVNLDAYLQDLYHAHSELIVVFLCSDYERKEWCGLEWRALRDLIKRREISAIMPLRFDNTEIPGLFSIDGYISVENRSAKEVAHLILQRWEINNKQN